MKLIKTCLLLPYVFQIMRVFENLLFCVIVFYLSFV